MRNRAIAIKTSILLTIAAAAPAAAPSESYFIGQKTPTYVELNNRILAIVNETPISVYDVMKKMDFIFYRQFAEYASSPEARHEFYRVNWKRVLSELIDKELIVADAKEIKLPVTNGDVRQEMENLFGPNIITNLDKIGMSFEEAEKIVRDDITIRRALYVRVNNKAINSVTPGAIRSAYEDYCQQQAVPETWNYRVITISNDDEAAGVKTADLAFQLLNDKQVAIDELAERINCAGLDKVERITVSQPFSHSEKEMSSSYKENLLALKPGCFSEPVTQKSRASGSEVRRIFYLADVQQPQIPNFEEVEPAIKNQLTEFKISAETDKYLKKLRDYYRINQKEIEAALSSDFEPFFLK